MSIATEIERLSGVRSDIFTSLTNKGVEVPETATFSSCPALIDSIPAGGQVDGYVNPDYKYGATLSASTPFTATQKEQYSYSDDYISSSLSLSGFNRWFTIPLIDLKRMGDGANGSATIVVNSIYYNSPDLYYTVDSMNNRIATQCFGQVTTASDIITTVFPPSALLSAYYYIKKQEGISDDSIVGIGTQGSYYVASTANSCTVTMKETTGTYYDYPDSPITIEGTYDLNFENTMFLSAYVSYGTPGLTLGVKLNQSANYPVNGSNTGSCFYNSNVFIPNTFINFVNLSSRGDMARSAFENTPTPSIDEVAPNTAYTFTFGTATVTSGEMFGNAFNTPAE